MRLHMFTGSRYIDYYSSTHYGCCMTPNRNSRLPLIAATILLFFPNYFLILPIKVAFAQTQNVQDRKAQGDKLNQEGLQLLNKGQLSSALEKFQEALAIMKEVGNRSGEGTTLNLSLIQFQITTTTTA
jgi:outer membrane protein assembly factor BamD (BamD/ComL family)